MGPFAILAVVVAGFFAGNLVFVAVIRWVHLVVEARNQIAAVEGRRAASGKVAMLASCQSLFHSGPWLLIAVGYFAYQVYSESWAPWLFAGFCGSVVFLGSVITHAATRIRKRSRVGERSGT
jgi:hypothetical protein